MKIIIELDVDSSDFDESDAREFVAEAAAAVGISIEVGRPIEEGSQIIRQASLATEYFKCRIEG